MKKVFKNINSFITKMKNKNVFFFVFLFILIHLFFIRMVNLYLINTYTLTYYSITYSKGLISRGLLGTVFSILGIKTFTEIVFANIIVVFSFMIFLSFILNKLIKKYNNSFIFLALIFLVNTGTISNMYSYLEFGRMDIYLLIYGIISMYAVYKKKIWFIPIISLIGMFTHENYALWIIPIISMLLLYEFFKNKDKKYLLVFIINIVLTLLTLLLIRYVIIKPNYESKDIFIESLKENGNSINYYTINDYYYVTDELNSNNMSMVLYKQNIIDYLIAGIGLFLVFGICLTVCFIPLYDKKNKIVFTLLYLSTFAPLLLFFVVCDWGRWYMYIMNGLILLTIYLLLTNEKTFNKTKVSTLVCSTIIFVIGISIVFFPDSEFHIIKYKNTDRIVETLHFNL